MDYRQEGFQGYYFADRDFQDLAVMRHETMATLGSSKTEGMQSFRWVGDIAPDQSGEYTFSTSDKRNTFLKIADQILIPSNTQDGIYLEAGQTYRILLEYQLPHGSIFPFTGLDLYWSYEDTMETLVPVAAVLLPDFSEDLPYNHDLPGSSLDGLFTEEKPPKEESRDGDGDGIFDIWEEQGWTIDADNDKRSWKHLKDEEKTKYRKYITNKALYSTTGDPFSDYEHAQQGGKMPLATAPEARHPLVAAFPSLHLKVNEIILSDNSDVTHSQSSSVHSGTSSSSTDSKTKQWDISATVKESFSPVTGPNVEVSVTGSYGESNTHSSTVEVSRTEGFEKGVTVHTNSAHRAFLALSMTLTNAGTAVISEIQPQFNLKWEGETSPFKTIKVQKGNSVFTLSPGESQQTVLGTIDEFMHAEIPLNNEQFEALIAKKRIVVELIDTGGIYELGSVQKQWPPKMRDIYVATARITLMVGDKVFERRVACPGPNVSTNPKITIREAIKIAFGAEEDGKGLKFPERFDNFKLDNKSTIIFDQKTIAKLEKQPAPSSKDGLGYQLEAGMGIIIKSREDHNTSGPVTDEEIKAALRKSLTSRVGEENSTGFQLRGYTFTKVPENISKVLKDASMSLENSTTRRPYSVRITRSGDTLFIQSEGTNPGYYSDGIVTLSVTTTQGNDIVIFKDKLERRPGQMTRPVLIG